MTFDNAECYVYITLPGQTEAVTAGRFTLARDRRGIVVGRFIYGRTYRDRPDAVEIDPKQLRLSSQAYRTARRGGVFGALRDSGPDFWGRLVMEKRAGATGLGEMEYLLNSADDRAGALGFGLDPRGLARDSPPRNARVIDLEALQEAADALLTDAALPDRPEAAQIEMLLGTSMGGARPKQTIEDDGDLWLAKFSHPHDRWNVPRVEHAMLLLARACGIETPDSRIVTAGGRDVLLIRRFDRARAADGYYRHRMVSAATLLDVDDTSVGRERWSYPLLADEVRRVCTAPARQLEQLFRRMVFNALISNTDDHPRNHAILADGDGWRISPAYDLTPSPLLAEERRDLAMDCGDWGRYANHENLLSQRGRFMLDQPQAEVVLAKMERRVKHDWHTTARDASVSETDCKTISNAFAYPGFRQRLT